METEAFELTPSLQKNGDVRFCKCIPIIGTVANYLIKRNVTLQQRVDIF